MAMVCELTFDRERLKDEIRTTYGRVAEQPDGDFHFHRGPEYAAAALGYDRAELDELPDFVTAPFAGVGNPFLAGTLPIGARVIDLGSGSGMEPRHGPPATGRPAPPRPAPARSVTP